MKSKAGQSLRGIGQAILLGAVAVLLSCAHTLPEQEDAIAQARRHLAAAPYDVRIHLRLAELYLAQRDYLRARQYLALVERGTSGWEAAGIDAARVFRLGIVIAVRGHQLTDAIHRCEEALEREDDLAVRTLLAALLESTGAEHAAERQHRLIIQQHPEDLHQLIELARFYERSSRPDRRLRAQHAYDRYLELAPAGPEAELVRSALLVFRIDEQLAKE